MVEYLKKKLWVVEDNSVRIALHEGDGHAVSDHVGLQLVGQHEGVAPVRKYASSIMTYNLLFLSSHLTFLFYISSHCNLLFN